MNCVHRGWVAKKAQSAIYTVEYYVQWEPVIYTRRTHDIEGNKQMSERQTPHVQSTAKEVDLIKENGTAVIRSWGGGKASRLLGEVV